MKLLKLILTFFIIFSSFAYAANVIYIYKDASTINQDVNNKLDELGYTVDFVKHYDADEVNYSNYAFMVVNDEFFPNPWDIPVNRFPSLILNTWNIEDFSWATDTSKITSNSPLEAKTPNSSEYITYGMNENLTIYTSCCENESSGLNANFLSKYNRAYKLKVIVSTKYDKLDAIIATATYGTPLRDGVISQSKGVFFGIYRGDFWTPESEQLFVNSVNWLQYDDVPPMILSKNVFDISYDRATVNVTTNKNSNITIYYGTSSNNLNLIVYDQEFKTFHSQLLSSLNEDTTHYYKVKACNINDFCIETETSQFKTLMMPPKAPVNLILRVDNADNNVVLEWQLPADHAGAAYNVYASEDPTIFDFTNPIGSTSNLYFKDTDSVNHVKRFYVVRAINAQSWEEKNTYVAGKFDLSLFAGVNLVSLPLLPFDNKIEKVMHQDASYNPVTKVYKKAGSTTITSQFNIQTLKWESNSNFDSLSNQVGYYFESKQAAKFTITGMPIFGTQTLNLVQGTNTVGFNILDQKQLNQIFAQNPADYSVVEISKRNSDSTYEISTYYPSNAPDYWYGSLNIEPGLGYVVKLNKAAVITY